MSSKLKIAFFICSISLLWSCSDDEYPNRINKAFKLQVESIAFENPKETTELIFKVSPTDAFTENGITATNCDISIISPENQNQDFSEYFSITGSIQNNPAVAGEYSLNITDKFESIYNYSHEVKLRIVYKDNSGKETEIVSNNFTISRPVDMAELLKTDLPVVSINTPDGKEITSKDDWLEGVEMSIYNPDGTLDYSGPLSMKGRGNTTWDCPKKPYALKLDKKDKILGMPKHKRWVLLANYYDKSNLRTEIAFFLGRKSEALKYTPRTQFVNYVMNGEYEGMYILTEQLKIDENRVSFGDENSEDGYLMEIDFRAGEDPEDIYFSIPHLPSPVVIKDPDVVSGDDDYNYVAKHVRSMDNALFSDDWLSEDNGYKNFIDLESFVDWYIVNEITKNNDAAFRASCYMNLDKEGNLKMGPLWDYDLALKNYPWGPLYPGVNDSDGYFIKNVTWFNRLFDDPDFISTLKERFNVFYNSQQELYDDIEKNRELISKSVVYNDNIWHFYSSTFDEASILKSHKQECDELIDWLKNRFTWLKSTIDQL